MNNWKTYFKDKNITVMGLGLLGRGVGDVAFLAKYAREITVTDLKSEKDLKESVQKLKKYKNIRYVLGRHRFEDFEGRDFIIKAAGVSLDSPYVVHARKKGVPVYMSTALFAKYTSAKIIGITGTRGKTSVSYMVYEILRNAHRGAEKKVYLGGNIQGVSTLSMLSKAKKGDFAVLELDSWQLQGFRDLGISPDVSVFTTFMPDHLNYYKGDLQVYFDDKAAIFRNQKKGDVFIAGTQLRIQSEGIKKQIPNSTEWADETVLPKTFTLSIPGKHNLYNAGIAYRVARSLGLKKENILTSLSNFKGVPGRLEKIRTFKGVMIYNDTTATTPIALAVALDAVGKEKNIILIMGGSEKNLDLEILKKPLEKYVKALFLIPGVGTERLKKVGVIPLDMPIFEMQSFEKLVQKALSYTQKGDVVLLSPGFASFGMFKNEYERGDRFVRSVKALSR